jgi:hypothetical protein
MQPGPMSQRLPFGPRYHLPDGRGARRRVRLRNRREARQTGAGMTHLSGSVGLPTMICANESERRELDKNLSCLDCGAARGVMPSQWVE